MLKPNLKSARLAALAVVIGGSAALWWHTGSAPQIIPGASRALAKPAVMASVLTPAVPTSIAGLTPAEGTNISAGDEQSAILAVLALPNIAERAPGLARELERWLARDSAAAIAFLKKLPRGNEISQGIVMALSGIARTDPDRALTLARDLVSTGEERGFYVMLFDRLARENAKAALPRLELVPPDFRSDAIRTIGNSWYNVDAKAALAWAENLSPAADRTTALEAVLSSLAMQDPRRAVELARKSLTGEEFERTATRAVQILANNDPIAAAELVALLPPGDAQTNSAMTVAYALAAQNIDSALEWIKTLPIDITRWMALNSVLSMWAQKDSKAAARYVLEMRPGQHLDFAAGHLALFLAANPSDAILWAEALPGESARNAAFVSIAGTWAQRAPGEALAWATSLTSEPLRTNAITSAHANWKMRDPLAASAWLQKADLPAATKRKIEFGLR